MGVAKEYDGLAEGASFGPGAAFSLPAGPRRSQRYACGRQVAAALPGTEIYPYRKAIVHGEGASFSPGAAFSLPAGKGFRVQGSILRFWGRG